MRNEISNKIRYSAEFRLCHSYFSYICMRDIYQWLIFYGINVQECFFFVLINNNITQHTFGPSTRSANYDLGRSLHFLYNLCTCGGLCIMSIHTDADGIYSYINLYVYIWCSLWRSCVQKTKSISVCAAPYTGICETRHTTSLYTHPYCKPAHNWESPTPVYFCFCFSALVYPSIHIDVYQLAELWYAPSADMVDTRTPPWVWRNARLTLSIRCCGRLFDSKTKTQDKKNILWDSGVIVWMWRHNKWRWLCDTITHTHTYTHTHTPRPILLEGKLRLNNRHPKIMFTPLCL